MNTLGAKIKEARTNAGMSQETLATVIGVKKATISRYESGDREPRFNVLKNIASALGVSVGYLMEAI